MSIIVFILGAILGSTLGCINTRRDNIKGFLFERSRCDTCNTQIKFVNNIPILSYILLKGRCPECRAKIKITTLIYEVVCAVLFLIFYIKYGLSSYFVISCVQTLVLVSICITDLEKMEIYTADLYILAALSLINLYTRQFYGSIIISLIFAIFYILLHKINVVGDGDVYLGAISGLYATNYFDGFVIFRNTFIFAAIYGIFLLIALKKDKKSKMPLCPFIVMSIFSVMI